MEKWINKINSTTKELKQTFSNLTEDQLNWKANVNTWSIAQNIDHIINVNKSYFPVLDGLKSGKTKLPFLARFRFLATFFGNAIKKVAQPERKKRTKTFKIWEPAQSEYPKAILRDFELHQAELIKYIEGSKEFLNGETIITSPASNAIFYHLETAFDIIVSHEERHLNQAKEVLDKMKSLVN